MALFAERKSKKLFIKGKLYCLVNYSLFVTFCFQLLSFSGQAQCSNLDFELSSPGSYTSALGVSGWTISSQSHTSCGTNTAWTAGSAEFSIVATALYDPILGAINNSPFGGARVAKLHDNTPGALSTKLARSINVNASNSYFQFAFAGAWQSGLHGCCEQANLKVNVRDCSGNLLTCQSITVGPKYSACMSSTNFSIGPGYYYTNWTTQTIDLQNYLNSCVTVEIIISDCIYGDHFGYAYVDVECASSGQSTGNGAINYYNALQAVSYCAGGNTALIKGPSGYSFYQWVAPLFSSPLPASQASLQSVSDVNPIPGSVWTLTATSANGCISIFSYTLNFTQVSNILIQTKPSCLQGASGSATVHTSGATGLYYVWTNSTNSIVGTSSVATGLSPGNYTVTTSSSNSNCGSSTSAVVINTIAPQFITTIKPYCGGSAIFNLSGGSNYQWYLNYQAIALATQASYTLPNAVNGLVVSLSYTNAQMCRDSINFILNATPPGSLSVFSNTSCNGAFSQSTINVIPSNWQNWNNYFIVKNIAPTPFYSNTLIPNSNNGSVFSNLVPNGTYSLVAFDGSCALTNTFTIPTVTLAWGFNVPASNTVCNGSSLAAAAVPSIGSINSGLSYSWSPNQYLAGNANTYSYTIIYNSIPQGSQSSVIYSVTVSSNALSCAVTKTILVSFINPVTPSLTNINPMCQFDGTISLVANPGGGVYQANTNCINSSGILTPSLALVGNNTYTYTSYLGSCGASANNSFNVLPGPIYSVVGNTSLCANQTGSLYANSTLPLLWSTGSASNTIFFTPGSNTIIGVTATNTNGCVRTIQTAITVSTIPSMSLSGNFTLCLGETSSLIASGANTYTWNNILYGSTVGFTPINSSNYTLQGASLPQCISTKTFNIIVNPLPVLSTQSLYSICDGQSLTLFVNGAQSYSWNGVSGSSTYTVAPLVSTNYTVEGNNADNCKSKTIIVVSVDACTGQNTIQKSEVSVYPNPTLKNLAIKNIGPGFFYIRNAVGQILANGVLSLEQEVIDLSEIAVGIYELTLIVDSKYYYFKIIKIE